MQNFPVPKNSIREWTEWFRGFDGDPVLLRDKDYKKVVNYVDDWIKVIRKKNCIIAICVIHNLTFIVSIFDCRVMMESPRK